MNEPKGVLHSFQ